MVSIYGIHEHIINLDLILFLHCVFCLCTVPDIGVPDIGVSTVTRIGILSPASNARCFLAANLILYFTCPESYGVFASDPLHQVVPKLQPEL